MVIASSFLQWGSRGPSADLLFSSWGSTPTRCFPPSLLPFVLSGFLLGNAPLLSVTMLSQLCSVVSQIRQQKRLCCLQGCRARPDEHCPRHPCQPLWTSFFFLCKIYSHPPKGLCDNCCVALITLVITLVCPSLSSEESFRHASCFISDFGLGSWFWETHKDTLTPQGAALVDSVSCLDEFRCCVSFLFALLLL